MKERVTHLCLGNFYVDGYSYQENLLTKFHARQGHEVSIIASPVSFDENGKLSELAAPSQYFNENDIPVQRLAYRGVPLARRLRLFRGLKRALLDADPTVLFIHNPQFMDACVVAKYLQNRKNVRVFVDNHADFGNSATNWPSRWILHGLLWRWTTRILTPFTQRFYGVLPSRVDFLRDVYGTPSNLTELLPMGADDEDVAEVTAHPPGRWRKELGLPTGVTLLVTGGKIDHNKPEALNVLRLAHNENLKIHVAVFGNVVPELQDEFTRLSDHPRVHKLDWLGPKAILQALAASDLAVFPGKHSVLWEQACALGVPLLIRSIPGTEHIDIGGNYALLKDGTAEELERVVRVLLSEPDRLDEIRLKAADPARRATFLYGNIAERAIAARIK